MRGSYVCDRVCTYSILCIEEVISCQYLSWSACAVAVRVDSSPDQRYRPPGRNICIMVYTSPDLVGVTHAETVGGCNFQAAHGHPELLTGLVLLQVGSVSKYPIAP